MTSSQSTVLRARKVISLDPSSSKGEWIFIRGDRIEAVGSGEPPSADRVIKTEGVVLPGMIDAHVHLTPTGLFSHGLDLRDSRSVPAALEAIDRYLNRTDSKWVIGGAFDPGRNSDGRMPTRHELDRVSEGRYLLVSRTDGHSCSVNSATLDVLELDPTLPGVEMNEDGSPTGVLANQARYEAGSRFLSRLPEDEVKRAHRAACRGALQRGVVSVHEMSMQQRDFEILMETRDSLPIDVKTYFSTFDVGLVVGAGLDCIGGDLFLDGSIGSHTAAFSAPYSDRPDVRGSLYHSDEEIIGWFVEASRAGLQCGVHAIGDEATEQAIRCLEAALIRLGPEGALGAHRLRHRIEHFESASAEQIERAGRLGMVASMQPMFDRYWGGSDGMYYARLGDRALGMNPLAEFVKRGVTLAGGSDSTVTPLDPFLGIAAAVKHHVSSFALAVEEALRMFTAWAAYAAHEEQERGSLGPGKRADLCVVADDPFVVDPDRLADIAVLETWVGGERP